MNTTIRSATKGDIPRLLEIFNHEIINSTAVYSYEPYSMQMMLDWYEAKCLKNYPVIVAENNSVIQGYATYGQFRDRPAYQFCHEHSVYIHKDHRRNGIANKLMNELTALALKNKVHTLIGVIDSDNIESIAFHKKLGFKEVGYLKEVAFKFDKWLDLKFYQLMLK